MRKVPPGKRPGMPHVSAPEPGGLSAHRGSGCDAEWAQTPSPTDGDVIPGDPCTGPGGSETPACQPPPSVSESPFGCIRCDLSRCPTTDALFPDILQRTQLPRTRAVAAKLSQVGASLCCSKGAYRHPLLSKYSQWCQERYFHAFPQLDMELKVFLEMLSLGMTTVLAKGGSREERSLLRGQPPRTNNSPCQEVHFSDTSVQVKSATCWEWAAPIRTRKALTEQAQGEMTISAHAGRDGVFIFHKWTGPSS